ncbi:hypothetical protein [Kutzneria kofuensis]
MITAPAAAATTSPVAAMTSSAMLMRSSASLTWFSGSPMIMPPLLEEITR